ncbi:MAG: GTP-binding protein Obg [uncultured Rubrobacteraceae bacterium]|uniref:GTPase Obg n=1 Tax=uncultured Rubrobacteraceae bacterium TaxID=349277 RepID=A0A6J4P7Y5_9ACTN|nr:MAG: GTP-binding protein Obg [uncultured Rubrobacteraceae bacterium]
MQFVDEARFVVRAGRGGDGAASFNREKYKPRGGPDGGRGGDGGSVIFRATEDLQTLEPYAHRNLVKAERGRHGSGNNRAGEKGADVVIDVPVGTLVHDEHGLLADLSEPGQEFVAAGGGSGGRGNGSFATSTRQAPAFREKGLPGEEREVRLELRVLSDVGLVGLPNAGKSSLLAALSAARPKVGDYPFTTLTPGLGVVDEKTYREPFVVADIPGLISGASQGRGLGNRFLRHIARARFLALVLDASEDPEGAEATLRAELHVAGLSDKPAVVVLNKIDTLDDELREYLRETFTGSVQVSALTGEGVAELRDLLEKRLRELGERETVEANGAVGSRPAEHRVFRPTWKGLRVERVEDGAYEVSGEVVERLALRTDWESSEGVRHFQRELERKGVVAALRRAGAKPGDEVRIGEVGFDFR